MGKNQNHNPFEMLHMARVPLKKRASTILPGPSLDTRFKKHGG